MKKYGLSKQERIKLRNEVKKLFESENKKIANYYPIKTLFIIEDKQNSGGVKILISVPSKKIKKAVKRNRIKRQIKEVYRLNKTTLVETAKKNNKIILIGFIYVSHNIYKYDVIARSVKDCLKEIINHV